MSQANLVTAEYLLDPLSRQFPIQQWTVFLDVAPEAAAGAAAAIPQWLPGSDGSQRPGVVASLDAEGGLDFASMAGGFGEGRWAVAMADVQAQADGSIHVGAAGNNWWVWFTNGQVSRDQRPQGNRDQTWRLINHEFNVPLTKGRNTVCVAVRSGWKGWAMFCGGCREIRAVRPVGLWDTAVEPEYPQRSIEEGATRIVLYPSLREVQPSPLYQLTVNGRPVQVRTARVARPFTQPAKRPEGFDLAHYASFDFSGKVTLRITAAAEVRDVTVRPLRHGIVPVVSGNDITLELAAPCKLSVELNGHDRDALLIFANPLEDSRPDPRDAGVRYFGPGIHYAGRIRVGSGETVYIHGGAIVHGQVYFVDAANARLCGRGVLDSSQFDRSHAGETVNIGGVDTPGGIAGCDGVMVEGVTLLDPANWTIKVNHSRNVRISNVKIIGWRANSDGIDVVSSSGVAVEDCFVRSWDDCLVVVALGHRGWFEPGERKDVADVAFRNCVLWCDWARAIQIGFGARCREIRNIAFENIDVIHQYITSPICPATISILNNDAATISDIRFEHIRIERIHDDKPHTDRPRVLELRVDKDSHALDKDYGRLEAVLVRDVQVDQCDGRPLSVVAGHDAEHGIRGLTIENLRLLGNRATDAESACLQICQHANDIRIS
jgi:hypothetical protein